MSKGCLLNRVPIVSILCIMMTLNAPVVRGQEISEDYSLYPGSRLMLPGNNFGRAMAIDNGVLAVGAYFYDFDSNFNIGSVHLFNVSTGDEIQRLTPLDGEFNNVFGRSIDMKDGIVVVGANSPSDLTGSVYVFDASTGIQLHKLTPEDNDTDGNFGFSVAIDNG